MEKYKSKWKTKKMGIEENFLKVLKMPKLGNCPNWYFQKLKMWKNWIAVEIDL